MVKLLLTITLINTNDGTPIPDLYKKLTDKLYENKGGIGKI